uniref:IgGFc_binding domain-containing protein n=1 Tax=Angiostrongylus cantonensis TaxID=6313 RepID=A0A0K0CVG4_ANGCA
MSHYGSIACMPVLVTSETVDDTLKSQLSVEFDSYSSISEADSRHFMIPSGVVCNGWKEEPIPLNASDPYSVHIQIVDEKKSLFESTAYYSASEGLIAVSGARKDDVVPFVNEKNVPKGVVSVVHDFNSGYEYGLDSSRCVSFSVLPTESDDVVVSNGTYSMRPLAQILIPSQLSFGNYGALKAENGRTLTIYRGLNNKANVTVEVHFDGDQLDRYTTYKTTDGSLSILSFTKFTPTPDGGVSSLSEKLRACFAVHDRNPNNTFTLAVKSKSIKDVYDKGVDKVTSALAESLSKIGPINPLRDTGSDDSLRVFLSLVEKANVKPATVPKYNYTAEVLSSEFVEKLNKTISQGDWKFLVPNFGNNPEEWVVVGKSFERYTPSSTASTAGYVGYTGGAMFVLGVFTLVLGVAIGAGGVFFVTRRQRISTLAYQVFE